MSSCVAAIHHRELRSRAIHLQRWFGLVLGLNALPIPAQGEALGYRRDVSQSAEGATYRCSDLQLHQNEKCFKGRVALEALMQYVEAVAYRLCDFFVGLKESSDLNDE